VFLDLKKDATAVYSYVVSRVSKYTPGSDRGPGGNGPIHMIYAGYEFDQAGWFALVFDRRADAGHDGEWTCYLEENILARPHWAQAAALCVEGFSRPLGEMLVDVLQRAERDGVFAKLPLTTGYRMGVEELNGSFGWDSQTGYGGQPE
jgi:hypothetical protein